MSWRGTFERLLLIGALFVSLPCYSLSADCQTLLAGLNRGEVGAISRRNSDDLDVAVGGLPEGSTYLPGFLDQVTDPAPVACLADAVPSLRDVVPDNLPRSDDHAPSTAQTTKPAEDSESLLSNEKVRRSNLPDFNRNVYYRNKLEFAFDVGALPINIPFPFDFIEGDSYIEHPIKYTLVPIIASLRWHISNIGGPWIFRGNWDLTSSGSFTWIPSGPETRYISYDMGIRRNFVPRNRRFAPYFDIRLGVGQINAKGPKGVPYAQGENWPEFTMNMGSGVRYNFGPRYAFTAGLNYMHLSNMDLSEHKPTATDPHWGPINYGINVYGPMIGIEIQLRKRHPE